MPYHIGMLKLQSKGIILTFSLWFSIAKTTLSSSVTKKELQNKEKKREYKHVRNVLVASNLIFITIAFSVHVYIKQIRHSFVVVSAGCWYWWLYLSWQDQTFCKIFWQSKFFVLSLHWSCMCYYLLSYIQDIWTFYLFLGQYPHFFHEHKMGFLIFVTLRQNEFYILVL